jgi:hypothetical protein
MDLAEARALGPPLPPVRLEALILERSVVRIGGEAPPGRLAALHLGDWNRLVLATLCATYGAPDEFVLPCTGPDCGSQNELPFEPGLILGAAVSGDADGMRLPVAADLLALAEGTADDLVTLCAPDAPRDAGADAALAAGIEACDPCAEITFRTACAECGADLAGVLDPLALLLDAMDREGGIMAELDRIARAYHWSEPEILALPAHRRRRYLRTIAAAEPGIAERRAS